jgi:hypothetical protein
MKKINSINAPKINKIRKHSYVYSAELGDSICDLISTNPESLHTLAETHDWMPDPAIILKWRWKIPEFAEKFRRARSNQCIVRIERGYDLLCDDSNDYIYDDVAKKMRYNAAYFDRLKMKIDLMKFEVAKLASRLYGDRIHIETDDSEKDKMRTEISEVRAQLAEHYKKDY